MAILDTKNTYFDSNGKIIAGGQLRFFVYGTTTPVSLFYEPNFITPTGVSYGLNSAGRQNHALYPAQSVDVYVDRYLGIDEYGDPSYVNEYFFPYIISDSVSPTTTGIFVDNIEALKELAPVDGMSVVVTGYFEQGDCPDRVFSFDSTSNAPTDLGTIFVSNNSPTGRWVRVIDGPIVDCRTFGVLAGSNPTTSNSAFAYFVAYCQAENKTAYIPTGSYYLTSGGSLTAACAIKADKDVQILSTNGTYTLTIDANYQAIDIYNTFASTGVTLIVKNSTSVVPDTAWGSTLTTLPLNFGLNIGLKLTKDQTIVLNNTPFYDIHLAGGTSTIQGSGTATKFIKNESDTGLLLFTPNISGDIVIDAPEIRSSMIDMTTNAESIAHILSKFTGVFVVDVPVVDAGHANYPSFSVASPILDIRASFDTTVIWYLKNIRNINSGVLAQTYRFARTIDITWFDLPTRAVASYGYSYDVASLDMQGRVTTATLSKYDADGNVQLIDLRNGTIKYINQSGGEVHLNNVHVNRTDTNISYTCVTASKIIATDSKFTRCPGGQLFNSDIDATLRDCKFDKTDSGSAVETYITFPTKLKMDGCVETNNARLTVKSRGETTISKCALDGVCYVIPQSAWVDNIAIDNSSMRQIIFDAAAGNQTAAVTHNINIYNNDLTVSSSNNSSITVVNGSTYKWAVNGHKNVQIYNNYNASYGIPCRSTSDQMRVKYTHYVAGPSGYRNYYMDVSKYLFVLNTNDTDIAEGLTGSGLYASYITAQFLGVNYVGTSQGMIFASYFNQWSNSRIYTNNQFWVRCFDHDIVSTDQWYVSWKIYK